MTFCQTVPPYSKRVYDSSPVLSTDISLSHHPLTKSHVPEDGDFINGRSGRQNLWVCRAISRASLLCWGVGRPSCLLQGLCCKGISERARDAVGWSASTGPWFEPQPLSDTLCQHCLPWRIQFVYPILLFLQIRGRLPIKTDR